MKLFHQYNLKILALISAIILWFVVITVENNVVKYPDPIQVQAVDLDEYYALSSPLPQVTVYLKMDATELKTISASDIDVFVDFLNIAEGTHTMNIEATVDGSRSKVLKVEPAEVTVTLTAVLEKEVPLKLQLTGEPDPEYKVTETIITPDTVKIGGAKAVLDDIESIDLPFEFSGSEVSSIEQDITVPNDNLPMINIEPEIVTLNIELESINSQKEVTITPNFIREEDRATFASRLSIEPAKVLVEGPSETIQSLNTVQTKTIEVSSLLRNESIEVKLELPDGVILVNPTQKIILKIK